MLSYRHAFHAGNHGDVLKHAVLALAVEYLFNKEKSFLYIDTHAGAGLYDLASSWAQKNREFASGILPIWQRADLPAGLRAYVNVVRDMNPGGELRWYPGSPYLVRQLMRAHGRTQDKARLFELHNNEVKSLQTLFEDERNLKIEHADGLQALKAILPPPERRALVLIDPSYEIKEEFSQVVQSLKEAYKRFATGVYLLWYPLIAGDYVTRLEKALRNSGIRDILLAQLETAPGMVQGMTGSAMAVINPPWTLQANLQEILPYLAARLAPAGESGKHRIVRLVGE